MRGSSVVSRLGVLICGLAIGLAAAELGLRLWSAAGTRFAIRLQDWDPYTSRIELLGDRCYRARPGVAIPFPNGTVAHVNAFGYRGPVVAIPKPPGTYRIVLLGGSTVHGFLVDDDDTLDAHLRRALADGLPDRRVEVVNLGFDGLDALCDLERLRREGLRLQPDAVVAHTGPNDVMALRYPHLDPNAAERGFRAERIHAEEVRAGRRGPWRWLQHHLFVARAPGAARQLWSAGRPAPGPPDPDRAALDAFEATIREITTLVPSGTTVLLSTPPSALGRDRGSDALVRPYLVVDAATTDRYRTALDARLRTVARDAARSGRPVAYVPHALPDDVFFDDGHLTGPGNRLLAADFAAVLVGDGARRHE